MGVALGWVALALTAVAGTPDPGRGGVPIKYTVRFVEADGVGWREAVFTRLSPVTRQGSATVWTAPHDVAERLVQHMAKSPSTHTLRAPTAIAWPGAPVHIATRANQKLITQVAWNGDDHSVEGKPELVRTGSTATMTGRKLDQGILIQMVLQDSQVIAVHRVALDGPAEPKTCPEAQKAACRVEECEGAAKCCAAGDNPRKTTTSKVTFKWEWKLGGVQLSQGQTIHDGVKKTDPALTATGGVAAASIPAADCCSTTTTCASCCKVDDAGTVAVEVPEIGSQEIAGEWLIPREGILLVSFGPHTVADRDGRAVVRERLAIVEAVESNERAGMPGPPVRNAVPGIAVSSLPSPVDFTPTSLPRAPAHGTSPAPMSAVPAEAAPVLSLPPGLVEMPMPPMPSRSIPQGYHSDGSAADLPPLPPDEGKTEDASESAEPRPSPQETKSRKPESAPEPTPQPGKSTGDSAMKKAQFALPSLPTIPSMFQHTPAIDLQFLLPIKPVFFRLPFNRRLEIEIYGRVIPNPEPAHNSADLMAKRARERATRK